MKPHAPLAEIARRLRDPGAEPAGARGLSVSARFPTSMDELRAAFARPAYRGAKVELWTFDSPVRRAALRDELRALGIDAHVRSTYKPLVFAFLEEIDLTGADEATILHPVAPGVAEERFRLEAYPLSDMVGGRVFRLKPDPQPAAGTPRFRVALSREGVVLRRYEVEAPTIRREDEGEASLSPTGWARVSAPDPALDLDARYETDLEKAYRTAMEALAHLAPEGRERLFDRLCIRIAAPFYDLPLKVAHEHVSTAEAMHEDIYFSILEDLRRRRGMHRADRRLSPGQIVPLLSIDEGAVTVDIRTEGSEAPAVEPPPAEPVELVRAERWLAAPEIAAHLNRLGGAPMEARSRQGRPVLARHIAGDGPALFVSAGQHPNETTGPVGALRAAARLAKAGRANMVVAPMMNPDGLDLFARLCEDFPTHMNHAARYTAGGNDLEYSEDGFEKEMYHLAHARLGDCAHLNLHGYPAHEWTRPFSGYLPKDFGLWTVPKGFFLILRHKRSHAELARRLLSRVSARLSEHPGVVALNRSQLGRYARYVGKTPFEVMNETPYVMQEQEDAVFPVTLITEAPDETVSGEEFRLWQEAQMLTVLAAHEALEEAEA